jgi:heptaprenyl diphosphate synthase
MALLTAIALTIFMVEAQIPAPVPVPGIKLGLSNIVTMFAVFVLGGKEALAILFARVFLGAVFSGQFSTVFYSAAGGLLAWLTAVGLKRILTPAQIWVAGCIGAIAHSVGQMAVAVLLTGTPGLVIYLPVMILCGIVSGLFTGLCAQLLVNRGKKLWKTFLQ